MSAARLVREPTWSELQPPLPEETPAEHAEASALQDALGLVGQVFELRFGGRPAGMFRLQPTKGPSVFLKRLSAARADAAIRAEATAGWLDSAGVPVVSPLAGSPRPLVDGSILVALPYIDGRRLGATPPDLSALGTAVAQLHAALATHPERRVWEAATAERLAELGETREKLARGLVTAGPDPACLAQLAADPTLDFVLTGRPATPLHGDLNPGNALIVGQTAFLLDFEDVFHSVLPVEFELALMIERFVMVPTSDDAMAVELGRCLLSAYRGALGQAPANPVPDYHPIDPVRVLRSMALRSLCVLAVGSRAGKTVSGREWRKFFHLEQQARTRSSAIETIFEAQTR